MNPFEAQLSFVRLHASISSLHTPVAFTTIPHELKLRPPSSRHLTVAPETQPLERDRPTTLVEVAIVHLFAAVRAASKPGVIN